MDIFIGGKSWTEKVLFKVIDSGSLVRKKYQGSLHCFGDEFWREENAPLGIVYIGPEGEDEKYLRVVFDKNKLNIAKVKNFLQEHKIQVEEIMPEINSKENWNKFVLQNGGSFLQSWEWGEFQRQFGRKIHRFGGDGWQAQIIEMNLPLGKKYWYCAAGPIAEIRNSNFEIRNIMEDIKKAAKENGAVLLRIEPFWEENEETKAALKKEGFKRLDHDINPAQTLVLDISKSEDEILNQMHHKWRYNIHLAGKKGIAVKMVKSQDGDFEKYFEDFYSLMAKMSARQGIKSHLKEYYRKQLEIGKDDNAISITPPNPLLSKRGDGPEFVLFVAEYENKIIAANIAVFFGDQATYLHGAADLEFKALMAPHLLQWEQIKEAKKRGLNKYDFWGITNDRTTDKKRRVSWEGFTRFKKGFGGEEKNFMGVWDLAVKKGWYGIYKLAQKIRK